MLEKAEYGVIIFNWKYPVSCEVFYFAFPLAIVPGTSLALPLQAPSELSRYYNVN